VVRTGPRLRVVLHPEGRHVATPQALDHTVVQVGVGDVGTRDRALDDCVVVVLTRDLDRARLHPTYRVVAAVVTELQLERVTVERAREQLVTEADAEDGDPAQQPPDGVDRVRDRSRVARTVRQEHAVGGAGDHVVRRGRGGHHLDGGDV